jgi:hypothetical protein
MTENEKIIACIHRFCRSFDEKGWEIMKACLTETIHTDYRQFRETLPEVITAGAFIALRRKALQHLITSHHCFDFQIRIKADEAVCDCRFEIQRFEKDGPEYFHSFGSYRFGLVYSEQAWCISAIRQFIERHEGNPTIHGAFKN